MAGINTLTVRPSEEVFIANISIMSAGLNLHTACCKGLLVNMHFSAKTILQMHGRLNRLGQTKAVKWHNLKLSAEANLPSWITGSLREAVLFELMKAYFNHPFNRYAWVVTYDLDGIKMDYYTEAIIKLGTPARLLRS
ncbi:uncharacterized protein TrAFT101_004760 [Trichoderma asperellum]|uniref:uncharacterized protein n=1 Tax=Trichoderma asperellum TaxID=101201 RepID=UPI00332F18D1|nr:hypothetical protein TrAFT101_004760 [Trichoderma asperellum]